MKTASIRIRIEETEKEKIEAFASRTNKNVSDILRNAAATAICGDVPGVQERRVCAAARRSANQVLDILATTPVDIVRFRAAVVNLRAAAREVVQRQ